MILKEKDSLEDQIQDLEQVLTKPLAAGYRRRVKKDLAQIRSGLKGEQEAAYHIDFHLKDSLNWAVIHDLRIEWNGRVAQIDHLLIDRCMEIFVVESKSFRTKVRYANGGWERLKDDQWEGIPSPVEQNDRHIAVLKELIKSQQLAPTRFGLALRPTFFNIVVVLPSCSVDGEHPDDARIYRMDSLVKRIRAVDPSALDVLKIIAPETLHAFAAALVACHKPASKLQLLLPKDETAPIPPATAPPAPQACQGCGGLLTVAEANYCAINKARFGGQLLCRECQRHPAKKAPARVTAEPEQPDVEITARCAACGAGVDRKVVAFCRFNSRRFAGRVLCRDCQSSVKQ